MSANSAVADGTILIGADTVGAQSRTEEFTQFARQALGPLTRTAWHLTGDEHQASELVQQTLVRTYNAWGRARKAPLPYARKVMANQRINTWRSRRREVLAAPERLPEKASPDEVAAIAERDRLVRALACLGTQQRQVVVLRHVEGFSEKDVAEMLGIPVGTVKSAGWRGLERLREELRRQEA
ncbi:MAG: SigE family RNA polymerase sigma factor [Micrococcales bacterium]|nr:SigE family RNA polymerase sigma factor [Micrococcales bacterium]MCL2667050.1 SigE family RNA polymerase sigma factor [Micrococcales bacterium]